MHSLLFLLTIYSNTLGLGLIEPSGQVENYEPKGKQVYQFFKFPKNEYYKRNTYRMFCQEVKNDGACEKNVSYEKYKGRKFYFAPEYHERFLGQDVRIRKVIVDNGNVIFYSPLSTLQEQSATPEFIPYYYPGNIKYAPNNGKEFIFYHHSGEVYPENICFRLVDLSLCELPMTSYNLSGLKGFVKEYILKTSDLYIARLVLENGLEVYFKDRVDIFAKGTNIISLGEYDKSLSWRPKAILKGSDIVIEKLLFDGGEEIFKLSTGDIISSDSLDGIRLLSDKSKEPLIFVRELIKHVVEYDKFEGVITVYPKASDESSIYLRLTYNVDKANADFNIVYRYWGSESLDLTGIIGLSGDYRWEEHQLNFNRVGNSKPTAEAIYSFFEKDHFVGVLNILEENKAQIRFQGNKGKQDFKLSESEIQNIRSMVKVFAELSDFYKSNKYKKGA